MMNGGQPIGFVSARAIVECDRTLNAVAGIRDWERTTHLEQLMRAVGFDSEGGGFWHAVSPGQGMAFLQKLAPKDKVVFWLANLF